MFLLQNENSLVVYRLNTYIPLQREILVLGPRVGLDPHRENFAFGIPTCWYLKPSHTQRKSPNTRRKLLRTQRESQRKPVEYRLHWVPSIGACTFPVFCVDFISRWVAIRTQFPVEYGLNCYPKFKVILYKYSRVKRGFHEMTKMNKIDHRCIQIDRWVLETSWHRPMDTCAILAAD